MNWMNWVETKGGWVNLATATKILEVPTGLLVVDAQGDQHEVLPRGDDDLIIQKAICPVIGAAPGLWLHVIYYHDDDDDDTPFSDTKLPVIGWRVEGPLNYMLPLVPGSQEGIDVTSRDAIAVIALSPNHYLEVYEGRHYHNLQAVHDELGRRVTGAKQR
jgi:hypothetical protein